jgi:peptidoglycan/xylan/chitin deacetylase (PgdA/CDA1 family)
MTYLVENGYTTIDLYELTRAVAGYVELPEKPIVLTFDDGYVDNYEAAFPVLQEFGQKGTFFIITEFVDRGRGGYMTWPMIEEMARAGQRIESHSRTHPNLVGKPHEALVWEILGAHETLAAHIGYRPRYFCYPGGTYDEATTQMLRDLDYWGAVTTESGTWHGFNDRYEWTRVRVRHDTTMDEFIKLVDPKGTTRGKPPG